MREKTGRKEGMQMETHGVDVVGRGLQSRLVVVAVRTGQQVLASLHCGGVPALALHVVLGGALACDVHLCTGTEYRVQVNGFGPLSDIGGIVVFCFIFVFIAKDLQLFLLFLTLRDRLFVCFSLPDNIVISVCFSPPDNNIVNSVTVWSNPGNSCCQKCIHEVHCKKLIISDLHTCTNLHACMLIREL